MLPLFGTSLGGDSTPRWLEEHPDAVDCLEIAADGFFARPSPYLSWLSRQFPLVVRASGLSTGALEALDSRQLGALADVASAGSARFVVLPLGFSGAGEIRLHAHVPISLHSRSLDLAAQHIAQARERCSRPVLIEAITAFLRVPGSLAETAFLVELCRRAECRLLVDVTTLLVASRNHRIDPVEWLGEIPGHLIAAVRIGGAGVVNGCWQHDGGADIDEGAWTLMRDLLTRASPEMLLLRDRDDPGDSGDLRRDLERLRRLVFPPSVAPANTVDATKGTAMAEPPVALERGLDAREEVGSPERAPGEEAGRTDGVVAISPEASLFVLDDEGVFFSAARRELSLFNTQATLVWCLLEDGVPAPEVARAYGEAFGVEPAVANQHVADILQHWFGRGYISAPGPLRGDPVPLTTALAYLLTNAQLRARFRQSPPSAAEALQVTPEDRDAFERLDADELDAQADDVERRRLALRSARGGGRPAASPDAPGRRYRLLTTTFAISADTDALATRIDGVLGHLRHGWGPQVAQIAQTRTGHPLTDTPPDVAFTLRTLKSGACAIFDDDGLVEECRSPDQVVPVVKQLVREIAVERHPFLMSVHAGVVSFGDGCVLLPASAGSGKTTLTAGLTASGATYFSDEIAVLEEPSLVVRPVPLALTIKDGSAAPLRALYPEIDGLPTYLREDHVRVRYLSPPPASLPAGDRTEPVRWLVFPRYDAAAETTLQPIARPSALRRLLDESFVRLDDLDRGKVETLVQWMRTVECYDLPMSSLGKAVELVRSLMHGDRAVQS